MMDRNSLLDYLDEHLVINDAKYVAEDGHGNEMVSKVNMTSQSF